MRTTRDHPEGWPVQKKGRDTRRQLLSSTPLVVLFLMTAFFVFWYFNRAPAVRDISYGGLMQILKADDPNVRFQNVQVRRGSEVRGEMVVSDAVSDGTLTP